MIVGGTAFSAIEIGFAWPDPESAAADARNQIDRLKLTRYAAIASVCILAPIAIHAQAPTPKPERVQFAKGTSSKIIKGSIKGDRSRLFLINVRAGQTLKVKLVSSNASANFNLTAPGC